MKRFIAAFLSLLLAFTVLSACSKNDGGENTLPEDFRVTSYIIGDRIVNNDWDTSHLNQVTDMILFGVASFDEDGSVTVTADFEAALNNLSIKANEINPSMHIYINILGPKSQSDSDDWKKQMNDLSERNTNAFKSGKLESNILSLLEKYNFDGVFFDYEYPLESKYWKAFDSFLISLDSTLGDEFKIGVALSDWNANQSKKAIEVTDLVEVMAYDLWDDDGNHASMDIATKAMNKMLKKGYSKSQLDLGVPFYARPTTKDAYWYNYCEYYDKLDENGLARDEERNLTISFNTPDLIAKKTQWAIDNGFGGVMIWHYSCDLPADNEKSLFNAIYKVKQAAIEN